MSQRRLDLHVFIEFEVMLYAFLSILVTIAALNLADGLPVSSSEVMNCQHINGLSHIFKKSTPTQYKTILLDMWGVMHNGKTPYEGVLDTVKQLKELSGIRLVILSNSSKRRDHSVRMLGKLGFNAEDFDDIITSGEVSYRMLSGDQSLECETWSVISDIISSEKKEKNVFVCGSGDGDEKYCESAGWNLAPISNADLIVARGTFTLNDGVDVIAKNDDEEKYDRTLEEILSQAALRKVPMLVCNPDKVRPDEGLPPMPGAIGDLYEDALGGGNDSKMLVKRIGKPFKEVYDLALNGDDPSSAIMIGDALETDVTGGMSIGCSTLWVVNDGIHSPDVSSRGVDFEPAVESVLQEFNEAKEQKLSPSFIAPRFQW